MSTRWTLARRTDLGLSDTALGFRPFYITNKEWHTLYAVLKSLGAQGLGTLAGDGVLVPTNLAQHWGNTLLKANFDQWFQLGELNGQEVIPVGIIHEKQATAYLDTHELVPLSGSAIGDWLARIAQELATTPSGIIISSERKAPLSDVAILDKNNDIADLTKLADQRDTAGNLVLAPKLVLGFAWNARVTAGEPFDLDGSVIGLNENERALGLDWFCFYRNESIQGGAIRHLKGDNRNGGADGDDEQIEIDFSRIPDHVKLLDGIVTIDKAKARGQTFREVNNAYAWVFDPATGQELARVKLSKDAVLPGTNAVRFVQFYRSDKGHWMIQQYCDCFLDELDGMLTAYKLPFTRSN